MNRTVLFALFVTIITNDVTGFRLLPYHGTVSSDSSDTHTHSPIETSTHTHPRNVSDDYRKYSYLITTYL